MKRVAVLRGGPSEEHEVSMLSGQAVLSALDELGYQKRDLVITKQGDWLDSGIVRRPELALEGIDIVFVALHGHYGEDGQLQRFLHRLKLPYTGSAALASASAFNKHFAKETLRKHGLKTPKHHLLSGDSLWAVSAKLEGLLFDLGEDLFIKPNTTGSSHGTARIFGKEQLEGSIENLFPKYPQLLVEEFIAGREATVSVLEDFRGESFYALPAVEIMPANNETHFSTNAKYGNTTVLSCPSSFSYEEKERLAAAAVLAHQQLGCRHYSRSDFLVRNGEIYFLETNTLPGLTEHSLLPHAAKSIGLEYNELIGHLLLTARA